MAEAQVLAVKILAALFYSRSLVMVNKNKRLSYENSIIKYSIKRCG